MSRPLRLESAGALYHVTARGDRQQAIYRDDTDRLVWLDILAKVCARSNFSVHSFCQMTNHYHLLLETGDANLSFGMRQLNAGYAQYFNRRHRLVGHLFQGRYQALLVQKESYLMELARYVVLNPVRAGMVAAAGDWPWSSYRLVAEEAHGPCWMQVDWMLAQFASSRVDAIAAYRRFVADGLGVSSPMQAKRHQLFLGDEAFIARHRSTAGALSLMEVTKTQRRALALSLEEYQSQFPERDMAIAHAYFSTAYTMAQIADHFHISYATVSRIVRRAERIRTSAEAVLDCKN
ncbi:transposase [Duganella radicis]|uniref:Addiction module toxin RelE n=1 Tax=Duganella radicis TaxID=551988 RepID=A0A6L6PCC5_9BURK|nr:transposase [Duganella radicis]MTV36177.1 addiction module toxin RelE [Duganella radicis]